MNMQEAIKWVAQRTECADRRDRENAVRHAEAAVREAEHALADAVLMGAPWVFPEERAAVTQARDRLAAAQGNGGAGRCY